MKALHSGRRQSGNRTDNDFFLGFSDELDRSHISLFIALFH